MYMAIKRRVKKRILFVLISLIILCGAAIATLYITGIVGPNKYKNKTVKIDLSNPIKIEAPRRMSLVAVGDSLIHGAVYMDAAIGGGNYDFTKMFTEIEPLIKDYDLKYYNQETIIGGKDIGVSHYPTFNSPDEIGENLVSIGFNMVSLANNHAMDKGERAVLHSVEFWRNQKDVMVTGQSDSWENRNNIPVYEQNGIKFAFLSYTYGTNGIPLPYGKEYLVNLYSDEQVKIDIDQIKDKVDVIIVAMHWGVEYTFIPTAEQRREAEYLASLGVDLIIGSHPHVIQPVEYVGDTLVIYSLGNFISGQSPLGLDKIIGLMVGMDIVVYDDKVTFENVDYKLLYTYCTSGYRNYKVIPFENLTDDILYNHAGIEAEYMKIVTGE